MAPNISTAASPSTTDECPSKTGQAKEKAPNTNSTKRVWRPWPWKPIPDLWAGIIGLGFLIPPAPAMGILIGSGELSWAIIMRIANLIPIHLYIKKVIMSYSQKFANRFMKDPRNYNYVPHIFWLTIWAPALFCWALQRYTTYGFEWWFFFVYHFMRIGPRFRFFAHLHVLVHKEGHDHKGFFKAPFNILNYVCQWWVGPFYGQVPMSYAAAHNKIHHRYDNQLDDVHTNLDLDRSKFWSFVVYLPRFAFYWMGISPLHFFLKMKEWNLAFQMFSGMAYHSALIILTAIYVHPIFSISIWIFPLMEDMIFFGGISYLWHAWVDPEDITNQFVNSVTILKGKDNIWNEDFHVVHHTSPSTHWTNYPKHFEDHRAEYAKCKATIFQDTEEGELLFLMLSGNFDKMADLYVDLDGKLTKQEKLDLIMRRLTYVVRKDE